MVPGARPGRVGDEQSFGRDLHAAIPGLTKSRNRQNSARVTHYVGIRLSTPRAISPRRASPSTACPEPPENTGSRDPGMEA